MNDTAQKLSGTTITLHWIVGLVILGMLSVGIYMHETEAYALYPIHKSIGMLILPVILLRAIWRVKQGWPEPVREYERYEQILSKITHWALIIGTVLYPISGMMMSGAGGHGLAIFGWELLAMNPDPANPQQVIPLNTAVAEIGHTTHVVLTYIVCTMLPLHILGAFKHHIMDKDTTLRRMLGRT